MTAIDCRRPDSIFTSPYGKDECVGESGHSIDTAERLAQFFWLLSPVQSIDTGREASVEGKDWIKKALPQLRQIAEMPDNWDAEGSPRPDPGIVDAVKLLLDRLHDSRLGAIPVPFVCPVAGGGIQFEWSSSKKHLEIEFVDISTIAFLKEEMTPQGESTESGEYLLADAESTRKLLDWFAAV